MNKTMTRLLALGGVAAAVALTASQSFAAALVTYGFESYTVSSDAGAPADSTAAGVTASNLAPNSAALLAQGNNAGNVGNYFFTSGSGASGRSVGYQSQYTADSNAAAITANTYDSFTLTPAAGSQFVFGAGDAFTYQFQVRNLSNGNAAFVSGIDLRSSVDDYATSIGTVTQGVGGFTAQSISLASLGTTTGPVTFRLYLFDNPAGTNGGNDSKLDTVVVNGTVAAVPEPASLGLLGLGGVALLGRRRKAL